jgi:hypothetical protein
VLASGFSVVGVTLHTFIRVRRTTAIVMNVQAAATAGTDHQTGEVRRSASCCPHGIGTSAIGLEPRLVALIVFGRTVGWAAVGQQDEPFVCGHYHPTRAWSLRLLATRIFLSPSVDVEARIEGMFEHHLDRGPIGAAPDQFSFARALPHTNAKLDLVMGKTSGPAHRVCLALQISGR